MTLTELHGVLRAKGTIRTDAAPAGDPGAAPAWDPAVAGLVEANRTIRAVAYDSRTVEPGAVFVALKGVHTDGAGFVRHALDRGAIAIVSEQSPSPESGFGAPGPPSPGSGFGGPRPPAPSTPDVRVPWIVVQDARLALAEIAAAFCRHPSAEMQVVGITGTNGKTTTAYVLSSIFEAAGIRCGVLGTVAYRVGDEVREATRTTPEAPDVQQMLREMVDRGCGACAMEVSSHALALRRVDGTKFAAAVFTNLTRDHLDFHEDMEQYFRAKRRLFEMLPRDSPSLLNVDDPRGASLAGIAGRPVTFAIGKPADIAPGPLSFSLAGLSFDVRTPRGALHVRSKLVGRPNVYNILSAVATGVALDVPFEAIERGVSALEGVPGRFQIVSSDKDGVTVVVDYAHTDDALRNLLDTARPLARGRLITVFGCGGDRDRTKRPLMGAVAGRLSDLVIVTSDNPRSEDPRRIIEEIQLGITPDTRRDSSQLVLSIVDRREAIGRAIELAKPDDVVLIAGKGHEKYQVIGEQVLPFDDVAAAREALARRRTNSSVV